MTPEQRARFDQFAKRVTAIATSRTPAARTIPERLWPLVKKITERQAEPVLSNSLHIWEESYRFTRGRTLRLYFRIGAPDNEPPEMEIER